MDRKEFVDNGFAGKMESVGMENTMARFDTGTPGCLEAVMHSREQTGTQSFGGIVE